MLDLKKWKQVDNCSPGYLGERRNDEWAKRDKEHGKGNWEMGWLCGENVLQYEEICHMYEDAYFLYLQSRPELVSYLSENASDVYDDDPSNVDSGTDYYKRGEVRTHIQDISIRRCMFRLGKSFTGKELIQIRDVKGKDPISRTLSPGQVPFHRLDLFTKPDNLENEVYAHRWWLKGSVEDFYQVNKRIFVKR